MCLCGISSLLRSVLCVGFVVVTLAACADSQPNSRTEPDLEQLLESLDELRRQNDIAAVGLAISSRDEVRFAGGLGTERHGSDVPVNEHTGYRLGSVTKSFVGLTALTMSRQYPALFEEPVNRRIPGLLGKINGGDTVRLRQLLEHTAGLSDLSKKEFDFQGATVSFENAIQIDPATRVLKWPAGLHSSYSNAGFGYAGYFLEEVGSSAFEELVQEHVLTPLRMDTAGFFPSESSSRLAAGYNTDGKTPIPYWHMLYRSFGGLNATPLDMGRFVQALLQPAPSVLFASPLDRQRFENPQTTLAAQAGLEYGYGLGNYHWFNRGVRYHGHGGDADGYLSHYGYSTQSGYGYFVVITAFQKDTLNQIREAIEAYLATLPVAKKRVDRVASVELPSSVLENYVGDYLEVTRRFGSLPDSNEPSLHIRQRRGQLVTERGNQSLVLEATGTVLFRRPWQPGPTYAFIEYEGDVYLQGDMGNFRKVRTESTSSSSEE